MKKALSFGINDFPGSQNDLRGCVNDTSNIKYNLGHKHGAEDAKRIGKQLYDFGFDVQVFLNSQVTKELFRSEVTKLVKSANPGDIIVIHASCHGTQLIDRNNDEADGYDEALYLYDGAFSDDEFSSILSQLKEAVICVFIMDCCFSGTITRSINQKARFKPLFSEVDSEGLPVIRKSRKSKEICSGMNHLVLTGCSPTQTSADAFIGGSYNGALTYAAMKELVPGITYKEWHQRILKWLSSRGYTQTPQLEGPEWMMNLGVFGSEVKAKKCFLRRWIEVFQRPIVPPPPNPPDGHDDDGGGH